MVGFEEGKENEREGEKSGMREKWEFCVTVNFVMKKKRVSDFYRGRKNSGWRGTILPTRTACGITLLCRVFFPFYYSFEQRTNSNSSHSPRAIIFCFN